MADEVFVENAEKVVLKNGEEVILPKLTVGKIMMVTESMNQLVTAANEKAPELFNIFSGDAESVGVNMLKTLPSLVPLLLSQIVQVLSKYLNKDEQWIKDNMDMEDLVQVTTPFLANILMQGNYLIGPLNQAMAKLKKPNSQ